MEKVEGRLSFDYWDRTILLDIGIKKWMTNQELYEIYSRLSGTIEKIQTKVIELLGKWSEAEMTRRESLIFVEDFSDDLAMIGFDLNSLKEEWLDREDLGIMQKIFWEMARVSKAHISYQ